MSKPFSHCVSVLESTHPQAQPLTPLSKCENGALSHDSASQAIVDYNHCSQVPGTVIYAGFFRLELQLPEIYFSIMKLAGGL